MFDFLSAYNGWGMVALRVAVGVIFVVHGWPKLKNPKEIAGAYHAPVFVGWTHGAIEFFGGVVLILGFYVQSIAFLFSLIMLGAIYFKIFKWKIPFMAMDKNGWEFDLILLAANLFLLLG